MKKKYKIAITGGIGSGKSTVCDLFAEKGYKVISADLLAKQLLHDVEVRKEIISLLGEKSYFGETPNKKNIAEIVFSDKEKLDKLNSIIHPRTLNQIEEKMDEVLKSDNMVFVESALVYEINREEYFDLIILVTASEEVRINRIVEREGSTREEVQNRISNQLDDEEKIKKADFVIKNDSSLEELNDKVEFIHMLITSM